MKRYLDIVERILTQGQRKVNRTGIDTLVVPFVHFEHDMSEGFPLLTTKQMPLKTIAVELEGFIHGITSKKWYQERGCKIWNEWSNPVVVQQTIDDLCAAEGNTFESGEWNNCNPEIRKELQRVIDDLGPIYGYQWRRFNQAYDENDDGCTTVYDQLKTIVDTLHKNPNDRRMVCSAWNPIQISRMALPPCHLVWNVVVIGDTLNLGWFQRSCDLMLGVPFNIASYGLLLSLLAEEAGLKRGILSGTLADCHIYENQIDVAKEQITRKTRRLPILTVGTTTGKQKFDIFSWTHKELMLTNYDPHPKLDFGPVAV